jgi:hypothetical protein
MSLDISLYNKEGECVQSMNWLRNPFGLCVWAEDNAHHVWKCAPKPIETLWYVCNHWSYAKSGRVNRLRFGEVVNHYAETLLNLEKSFYFFALPAYRQFIQPNELLLPREQLFTGTWHIKDSFYDDRLRLAIPVEHFSHACFCLDKPTTGSYQDWFRELVRFADALQDKSLTFYCSN